MFHIKLSRILWIIIYGIIAITKHEDCHFNFHKYELKVKVKILFLFD